MQYSQILKPENRVILISGASSGIGLAIAKFLLNEGYSLSLGVRNIEKTTELLSKCKSQNYIVNKFEATELNTIDSWVDNTIKRFGQIDGLINNAANNLKMQIGDVPPITRLEEFPLDVFFSLTDMIVPTINASFF